MVAEFGINSGGELLAQLIVRPTYHEQILWAQSNDIKGSKIRKKMEVEIEIPLWIADGGT
jgi:hypothetical protein